MYRTIFVLNEQRFIQNMFSGILKKLYRKNLYLFNFRFTTHKYDHLDIFEYPILSKLKHNIYMEYLEKNLNELNLFCEKNNLIMFNNEENFLRRKLIINPIRLSNFRLFIYLIKFCLQNW